MLERCHTHNNNKDLSYIWQLSPGMHHTNPFICRFCTSTMGFILFHNVMHSDFFYCNLFYPCVFYQRVHSSLCHRASQFKPSVQALCNTPSHLHTLRCNPLSKVLLHKCQCLYIFMLIVTSLCIYCVSTTSCNVVQIRMTSYQ